MKAADAAAVPATNRRRAIFDEAMFSSLILILDGTLGLTLGTAAAPGNAIPQSDTQKSGERGYDARQERESGGSDALAD